MVNVYHIVTLDSSLLLFCWTSNNNNFIPTTHHWKLRLPIVHKRNQHNHHAITYQLLQYNFPYQSTT